MKRETVVDVAVLTLLVAAGAGSRVLFHDLPNFAPIAALSLFAGYFFRRWTLAVFVPLLAMAISDAVLGAYQWQMMVVVYAMLALPVAARPVLRRFLSFERGRAVGSLSAFGGLVGCSLAASVLFYLGTNFAWWPWNDLYPHNYAGLVESYAVGLPFFRYTLTGDLFYACVLFGGYAAAVQMGWASNASARVIKPLVAPAAAN